MDPSIEPTKPIVRVVPIVYTDKDEIDDEIKVVRTPNGTMPNDATIQVEYSNESIVIKCDSKLATTVTNLIRDIKL